MTVGGERQSLDRQPTGYLRLTRQWQPNENIVVEFEFPLKAHFHSDREGLRYVAFTRGPLALAQDVKEEEHSVPVVAIEDEGQDSGRWLEPVASRTVFQIKGTSVALIPYYLAGATGGGVRTLFQVEHTR